MPQIKVEYSAGLGAGFDAHAFTRAIHAIVVEIAGADLGSCKTRLVPLDHYVIGDGSADQAMIHVDLRILAGRTEDQKTRLGEAVLAAAVAAIDKPPHLQLQVTIEVRELDRAHYHKRVL
jgi:5-carboxymethyl-2-hydroxymuconate isomerase